MIFATANTDHYIPIDNLSTAHKHYTTCTDLCSTIRNTLEACYNLSTAADLQHIDNIPQKLLHIGSKLMK